MDKSIEILCSRQFPSWLSHHNLSFALTTYQTGQFYLIGTNEKGEIAVFNRVFNRCMGLCSSEDLKTIYLSSLYQIWQFSATTEPYQKNYDITYLPQVAYTTGDLEIHDMAIDKNGELIFVNTLFSCLSTLSLKNSFEVKWKPFFISKLAPEDRCHLNGLALRDGEPRYVTCAAKSDIASGWKDQRLGKGVIIDILYNKIICEGLTMPHSPRWYLNRLWLLEAGTGYLGYLNKKNEFEKVTFCPGFLRGLDFYENYAFVGTSKLRQERTFSGMPIEETLKEKGGNAQCGVYIIDTNNGNIMHNITFEGMVKELYDVIVLPGIKRPSAIGTKSEEIRWIIQLPQNLNTTG